jgi:Ni,Fe-hydrogenase III large subunit
MTLVPQESAPAHHDHEEPQDTPAEPSVRYTCPMHPEVVQDEPGNCPKCGMTLVPQDIPADPHAHHAAAAQGSMKHDQQNHGHMDHGHGDHDHAGHDHGEAGFMSMIEVTRDLPRSCDGLPMDWLDVPFGPFFPGLPGGLLLTLTLDGDTVAGARTRSLVGYADLLQPATLPAGQLVEQLARLDPLAPMTYRLLACRAVESAADLAIPAATARARIGALERERIANHLNGLTLFAEQTGFDWLRRQATRLQLQCQQADVTRFAALKPELQKLIRRLERTPLIRSRLRGIGKLAAGADLHGPVARASGLTEDARLEDATCAALGFTILTRQDGDALARLQLRLAEILHSLALIEAAGRIEPPTLADVGQASGRGESVVETPRGRARLQLTLEQGQVTAAQLETPSTWHRQQVEAMVAQQALGDALVAVGSLDLSPWELPQ